VKKRWLRSARHCAGRIGPSQAPPAAERFHEQASILSIICSAGVRGDGFRFAEKIEHRFATIG